MAIRRIVQAGACLAVALAPAAALGACGGGGDEPSAEQVAHIKEQARRETLAEVRRRRAERQLRSLRRDIDQLKQRSGGSATSGGTTAPPSTSGGSTSCGDGLSVNSVTSCPFARNVRDAYEGSGGASTIDVYSPVTGQTYRMSCTGGVPVVCTGGNGAAVSIR